jgi:hypothetical protein
VRSSWSNQISLARWESLAERTAGSLHARPLGCPCRIRSEGSPELEITYVPTETATESELQTKLPVVTPASTTLDCTPQTLLRLRNSIGMFLARRSSTGAPTMTRRIK